MESKWSTLRSNTAISVARKDCNCPHRRASPLSKRVGRACRPGRRLSRHAGFVYDGSLHKSQGTHSTQSTRRGGSPLARRVQSPQGVRRRPQSAQASLICISAQCRAGTDSNHPTHSTSISPDQDKGTRCTLVAPLFRQCKVCRHLLLDSRYAFSSSASHQCHMSSHIGSS